ncbi:hypothetical protein QUH73_05615 [Labilibaculum sp. K2S]|uniref:hypothetical protein n=1 Tax=Labilibaculum sp. K2S TaxID=3056386 RepID=UPI0025A3516A|nr:hypothetical protein [Labilibaculum sp. K2S]MDM8159288.1 hypothetical protein [Labilibaculum sp. K2S]
MKKLLYMASFFALVFTSCDPMEDAYKEVDEANADAVADAKFFSDKVLLETGYTLTDADYALSTNTSVSGHMNFSSSATAADNLPEVLTNMKVYGEAGSEYVVNYNFYIPSSKVSDASPKAYEMTGNDYDLLGEGKGEPGQYGNFDKNMPIDEYLPVFLDRRFPIAKVGDSKLLSYKFYGAGDKYAEYEFDGTVWTNTSKAFGYTSAYELTEEDYKLMGEGKDQPGEYFNFSSKAKADNYLPDFLIGKYPNAVSGDKQEIKYVYYGNYYDNYIGYILNEDGWKNNVTVSFNWETGEYVLKTLSQTINASSLVAYKDKTWLFVPPIKFVKSDKTPTETYTLVYDDYKFVGNGGYGNFDEEEDVVLEKIAKIIKNKYEVAVGQVYSITYKYYSSGVTNKTVILEAVKDN